MRYYHPEIHPYQVHHVDVDGGHRLWVAESGHPDGIPVIVLHGGPGGGSGERDRQFFDPRLYRIIQFDQRGCGQSTPHGSLEANDPWRLVSDMETIRARLGIESWVCFGGSWGTTLALLYGQKHPDRVRAFLLRGVFLCRQRDLDWLYAGGAGHVFPEHWQKFVQAVDDEQPLLEAYHRRLTGSDELERSRAARAWAAWEGLIATLKPSPKTVARMLSHHTAYSMARISSHFFHQRDQWLQTPLLDNMAMLTQHPAIIVHGRYDMVCPVENAWTLKRHWPNARLEIIREAGHSAHDPAMIDGLVKATDDLAHSLGAPDSSA